MKTKSINIKFQSFLKWFEDERIKIEKRISYREGYIAGINYCRKKLKESD